ncbi:hypothetical protein D9613_010694 [Agrocybe pediades]|uniref:Integrase catalytic domain-containing protein n=1 Tax=Agrocybe pediades TaxID=84607 RepID=A0A8H4VJF3_9AGAR|nr:hypothetical protein D9613_010694 [Agrocybe pediades]
MPTSLPRQFPALPDGVIWSNQVKEAYSILLQGYVRAVQLLAADDSEPVRLRLNSKAIQTESIPLLRALEAGDMQGQGGWIREVAELVVRAMVELEEMATRMDSVVKTKLMPINPVTTIHTGRPGRPRKTINSEWIEKTFAPHRSLSASEVAEAIGINRKTLQKIMRTHGVDDSFSAITDEEIDILVTDLKTKKPGAGIRYVLGFFRRRGIKVQQVRVRESLRRVDRVGQAVRRHKRIQRRTYSVPHPNALWHMDGHHKLIRWGIVVHGIIDGYCRTLVGLEAATNNRASTVLSLFLKAVEEYGPPSRARADRGGENVEVSVWMILHQGPNRGSFLWGDSQRNQRIERAWVEVGSQVVRLWKAFFQRLERLHSLDISTPWHLWLLQLLFLSEINRNLSILFQEWLTTPGLLRVGSPKSGARGSIF